MKGQGMNGNKPTFYAYIVRDRGRDRPGIWTRIGAAWPHEKGNGLTVTLDALPLDGRIVLMEPKEAAQDGEGDLLAEV